VTTDNCLETTHPHLAKEWHPTKNGVLTPHNTMVGVSKKVWWLCPNGHEWSCMGRSRIRTKNSKGCPVCWGRDRKKEEARLRFEYIKNEWHPSKNSDLVPNMFSSGNSTKVWWLCPKNSKHEWLASISSRTSTNKSGCPVCNSSKGEGRIREYLKTYSYNFEEQYRIPACRNKNPLPFDFAVFINGIAHLIEFNGQQHYRPVNFASGSEITPKVQEDFDNLQRRDAIKVKYCANNNIPLLVIPYTEIAETETILQDFLKNNRIGVISS